MNRNWFIWLIINCLSIVAFSIKIVTFVCNIFTECNIKFTSENYFCKNNIDSHLRLENMFMIYAHS